MIGEIPGEDCREKTSSLMMASLGLAHQNILQRCEPSPIYREPRLYASLKEAEIIQVPCAILNRERGKTSTMWYLNSCVKIPVNTGIIFQLNFLCSIVLNIN